MTGREPDWFAMGRRLRHESPMRARRIGGLAAAGTAPIAAAFPGGVMPEPEGSRERLVSGGVSALLHALLILPLVLAALLAPEKVEEMLIEIRLPDQVDEQPAPRPKIISESAGRFDPAPMALAPTIVTPVVIRNPVATVQPQQIEVAKLAPVQAPKEIVRPTELPLQAQRFQAPVIATAQPLNVNAASAALSGPVDLKTPVGAISGPKQVASGNTVGIADPEALGSGSSVRDGIASDRDVHGSPTGARASVDSQVGNIEGRGGAGGNGSGPGSVSQEQCLARPEVSLYMQRIKERTVDRWITAGVSGRQRVQMRFKLDQSGAASEVRVISAGSPAIGDSAVEAMRAASPFEQMSDRVRCLAGDTLIGTFSVEEVD